MDEPDLAAALRDVLGPVTIEGLCRLSGGASRETWSFDAVGTGGSRRNSRTRRDICLRSGGAKLDRGPLRRLLVLEVSKHIAPFGKMLLHPIDHRTPLFSGIGRLAKAIVGKWRCHDVGRSPGLRLGDA